jgi:hypothetical protein
MSLYFGTNNAIAATVFREQRESEGLPVATKEQRKRALRIAESNPMMRDYHSPVGLEVLALQVPLSRFERVKNRDEGIRLQPHVIRTNDRAEAETPAEVVASFMEGYPDATEYEAGEAIAMAFGFSGDMSHLVKRIDRFSRSNRTVRIAGHLREKLRMLSAMAQAMIIVRERAKAAE